MTRKQSRAADLLAGKVRGRLVVNTHLTGIDNIKVLGQAVEAAQTSTPMSKDAVGELRQGRQDVFVPLIHRPGEAQVDYEEALVQMNGRLRLDRTGASPRGNPEVIAETLRGLAAQFSRDVAQSIRRARRS